MMLVRQCSCRWRLRTWNRTLMSTRRFSGLGGRRSSAIRSGMVRWVHQGGTSIRKCWISRKMSRTWDRGRCHTLIKNCQSSKSTVRSSPSDNQPALTNKALMSQHMSLIKFKTNLSLSTCYSWKMEQISRILKQKVSSWTWTNTSTSTNWKFQSSCTPDQKLWEMLKSDSMREHMLSCWKLAAKRSTRDEIQRSKRSTFRLCSQLMENNLRQ